MEPSEDQKKADSLINTFEEILNKLDKKTNTEKSIQKKKLLTDFKVFFQTQKKYETEFKKLFSGNFEIFENFTHAQYQLERITDRLIKKRAFLSQLKSARENKNPDQFDQLKALLKTQQEELNIDLKNADEIMTNNEALIVRIYKKKQSIQSEIKNIENKKTTLQQEKNDTTLQLEKTKDQIKLINKQPNFLNEHCKNGITTLEGKFLNAEQKNKPMWFLRFLPSSIWVYQFEKNFIHICDQLKSLDFEKNTPEHITTKIKAIHKLQTALNDQKKLPKWTEEYKTQLKQWINNIDNGYRNLAIFQKISNDLTQEEKKHQEKLSQIDKKIANRSKQVNYLQSLSTIMDNLPTSPLRQPKETISNVTSNKLGQVAGEISNTVRTFFFSKPKTPSESIETRQKSDAKKDAVDTATPGGVSDKPS